MLIIKLINGEIIETNTSNYKNALNLAKDSLMYDDVEDSTKNKDFINKLGTSKVFRNSYMTAYIKKGALKL